MSAPEAVGASRSNRVELSLAADAQMLFLARMTAAAVAARADFEYDQVEDLRLALDELCVGLMGAARSPGRIALLFQWDDDGALDVIGTLVPDESPDTNGSFPSAVETTVSQELAERILDALVDDHGTDTVGNAHRAWLRMRRKDHPA
jgi:hypothetical protein